MASEDVTENGDAVIRTVDLLGLTGRKPSLLDETWRNFVWPASSTLRLARVTEKTKGNNRTETTG